MVFDGRNKVISLPQTILQPIHSLAEAAYPAECCGLVLKFQGEGPEQWRLWPVCNIQDEMHRRFPAEFPRTSHNAYWMDPLELLGAHKALRPCTNVQGRRNRRLKKSSYSGLRRRDHQDPASVPESLYSGRPAKIAVIYHSHPDAEAFFSAEDERLALDDLGQPLYPEAFYLVVPVRQGKAGEARFFCWSAARRKFQS